MTLYAVEIRVTRTGELLFSMDDSSCDTARAAWRALHTERQHQEDEHEGWGVGEYSSTLGYLDYAATDCEFGSPHEDWPLNADGTGEIRGATPGLGTGEYDPEVGDPGLSYIVVAR